MVAWQHRHLTAWSSVEDAVAALLFAPREAFLGRSTKAASILGGVDDDGATESTGGGGAAGWSALDHRPASLILRNPELPDWVKRYAAWHGRQRGRYLDAKRDNSSSADDVKFLVSRCLAKDRCGGASDRLQDMPFNMMLANRTGRVLLVRWERPAPLENFLVPPVGGIDWTLPDDMSEMLKRDGNWHLQGNETDGRLKIVSTIRRVSAAPMFRKYRGGSAVPMFRKYENEEVGHKM